MLDSERSSQSIETRLAQLSWMSAESRQRYSKFSNTGYNVVVPMLCAAGLITGRRAATLPSLDRNNAVSSQGLLRPPVAGQAPFPSLSKNRHRFSQRYRVARDSVAESCRRSTKERNHHQASMQLQQCLADIDVMVPDTAPATTTQVRVRSVAFAKCRVWQLSC